MVTNLIFSLIDIMKLLLIIRALVSWFPDVARGQIGEFIYKTTEPMIAPVRNYMRRISFFNSLPIDVSFLVTYLLLGLLETFLYILL